MIGSLRQQFNSNFTEEKYRKLLRLIDDEVRTPIGFRVAETPIFLPAELMEQMVDTAAELTRQLVENPAYLEASTAIIPERYRIPEPAGIKPPNFMTVDFGFVREKTGEIGIRLVELQAFSSIFGFQDVLSASTMTAFGLEGLHWHLSGLDRDGYWRLLDEVIVAGHDPAEVVLLEVTPERQKTRADFKVYEDRLHVATLDITKVRQRGRQLEYSREGVWVPIRRIFNRAIADEMEREGITPGFDVRADLDVEWAGHPNWYFRASKFSLPHLDHPAVPRAVFLEDWLRDRSMLDLLPEEMLLKPLFSFAGKGI